MFTNNAKFVFDKLVQNIDTLAIHKPIPCAKGTTLDSYSAISNSPYSMISAMVNFASKEITYSDTYSYDEWFRGVVFGTGTGTPTVDDTTLFGSHITAITASNTTTAVSNSANSEKSTLTCVYTITNNTSSDITIGEVGLVAEVKGKSSSKTFYGATLYEHSVLDTPITIPAGGVGQVTYAISMDYPTFS